MIMKKSEKISVRMLFPAKQVIAASIIVFIREHPQVSWFHLQPVTGFSPYKKQFYPLLVIATKGDDVLGVVVALHIRNQFLRSLDRYNSRIQANGSPLINSDYPEKNQVLSLILEEILKYSEKKTNILEFRNSYGTNADIKIWLQKGFSYNDHLNLVKSISTQNKLWNELGENRRRQILKATKNGTEIRVAENEQQVRSLFFILKKLYHKKVKKALAPLDFFIDFFILCQKSGKGVILLAFKEDKVIGGIVCPIQDRNVMYEWYVCGLDKEYPQNHPSIMVTWHALLYACENGIRTFDFMGLGKPGIPYGVRDFKLRFGGEVVNYGRYTKFFHHKASRTVMILDKILMPFKSLIFRYSYLISYFSSLFFSTSDNFTNSSHTPKTTT